MSSSRRCARCGSSSKQAADATRALSVARLFRVTLERCTVVPDAILCVRHRTDLRVARVRAMRQCAPRPSSAVAATSARLDQPTLPHRGPPRHRRGPDRVPADLLDRPPDRRRLAARLRRARRRRCSRSRSSRARCSPSCWEYRTRFVHASLRGVCERSRRATLRRSTSSIAFVPAALLGLAARQPRSRRCCSHPVPVAIAFIAGAFVILWAERRQRAEPGLGARRRGRRHALDRCAEGRHRADVRADPGHVALRRDDHRRHAVRPVAQGRRPSSRSSSPYPRSSPRACTRCGRNAALLSTADLPMFAVGFAVSFVSALLCIRWLIRYVSRNDFVPFAWYRIAFGAVVLVTAWTGWSCGSDGSPMAALRRAGSVRCSRSSARSASRSRRS